MTDVREGGGEGGLHPTFRSFADFPTSFWERGEVRLQRKKACYSILQLPQLPPQPLHRLHLRMVFHTNNGNGGGGLCLPKNSALNLDSFFPCGPALSQFFFFLCTLPLRCALCAQFSQQFVPLCHSQILNINYCIFRETVLLSQGVRRLACVHKG